MIKNLEEATITFCENGFMLAYNYTDGENNYQNKRRVFASAVDMYEYINKLTEAKKANGNTSI
jgi:hypothetical protein